MSDEPRIRMTKDSCILTSSSEPKAKSPMDISMRVCVLVLFSQTALNLHFNVISPDPNVGRKIPACTLLG